MCVLFAPWLAVFVFSLPNVVFSFRYCFSPFGLSLGIKSTKPKKVPNNDMLEERYARNSKWNHKEVTGLAKRLDWTERQVERWLRLRRAQDKPSTLVKFCESR